ncbi:MAG: hypothetical protein V4616_12335, partial [Bacteroidota bacterium]
MKKFSLSCILLCLCFFTFSLKAQISFQNPSFEQTSGGILGTTATNWPFCNGSTDVEPGVFSTGAADEGTKYLGFWDGGATAYAGITPKLGEGTMQQIKQNGIACPLVIGKTYTFQLSVKANSTSYSPGALGFVGGFGQCAPTILFWRSDGPGMPALNATWKRYSVTFTADKAYTWIGFYAINRTGNEDVQLDNLSTIVKVDGTVTSTNLTCAAGGSIKYTPPATGGPFNVTIKNAAGVNQTLTGFTASNLPAGTYTVTVIDQSESCPVPSVFTVTLTGLPPITGTVSTAQTLCEGAAAELKFTSTSARSPLNVSWSGPNVAAPTSASTTATPTENATYTVTVTDPADPSCVFTQTVVITVLKTDPGTDGTVTLCTNSAPVDLMTKIGGTPDPGTWTTPSGAPFTNPLDPATAASGDYTFTAKKGSCPAKTSKVTVTINTIPNAGNDGITTICHNDNNINLFDFLTNEPPGGKWAGQGVNTNSGMLNGSGLNTGTTPKDYTYTYIAAGLAPCPNDTARVVVTVRPLPAATFQTIQPFCKGETSFIPLNLTGTPPFTVTYRENGTVGTLTGISPGDKLEITPGNATNTYSIVSVTDGGTPPCTSVATSSITVKLLNPPAVSVDSLVCNSINTGYTAYLSMTGGDAPSYTINTQAVTGTKYVSPLISSGTPFSFAMNDKNNCQPQSIVTGTKVCNCSTTAGTMASPTLETCEDLPITAKNNGNHFKDGNDVLVFILHDGAGSTLGRVIAVNKTTPVFQYDSAWGIQYETPYYVSTVVGDGLASDPTMVDLSNPNGCLSVAIGQRVIFHQLPNANAVLDTNQICIGSTANIVFGFTAGNAPYSLTMTGTPNITAKDNVSNTSPLTPANTGMFNYVVTRVTDKFSCSTALNIPLQLLVVERPDTMNSRITCNATNTAYTVTFDIFNGHPSSYTVNGLPSAAAYTSAPVPSGSPFQFDINDKNNCSVVSMTGTHICPCVSKAGTTVSGSSASPLEICEYNSAWIKFNQDQTLDANDVRSYILVSDNSNSLGSAMVQYPAVSGDSVMISFDNTIMSPGVVYYLWPVAGDSDLTRNVDLGASCMNIGPGTPVRFIAIPRVSLTGNALICQGDSTTLTFNVRGNGTVRFTLIGSDGSSLALQSAASNSYTTVVKPDITKA